MSSNLKQFFFKIIELLRVNLASLRVRVVGLVFLALVPAFILMWITSSENRQLTKEEMQTNMMRLAQLAEANQQRLIDGARDILITLAQIPAIQNQDRAACLFFLSNILMQHPLYANFGAADSSGNIFCMTIPQRTPVNIAHEGYFQQALLHQEFAISDYNILPTSSQAMITLAYPVLNPQGKSQGIVFASLDLRWIEPFMVASSLPVGSNLRVIDSHGLILASYPNGDLDIGHLLPENFIYDLVKQKYNGLVQGKDAHQEERLYALTPLYAGEDSFLYVVISVPTEAAFANSNRILSRNLIALSAGGILALLIAWFGTQLFFLRQVNALVKVTQKLSQGDLNARTNWKQSRGELNYLAQAFDDMATALQNREKERQWAESQIRRHADRAEALVRIANRLNAKLELNSLLQAICDETSYALNVPNVAVIVSNSSPKDSLNGDGLMAIKGDLSEVHPLPQSVLESLATSLDSQICQIDLHQFPQLFPQELNLRYLICADMIHEGKRIGRLDLYTDENKIIGEDERSLIKGIANEAALAITNAQLYTALQKEERARAQLLRQMINAQEEERKRIARELHDETSQSLTALLVGLDTIRIAAQVDIDKIDSYVQNLKSITQEMLGNIHRLIANLRPSLLDDLGLVAAIQWYGERRLEPLGINFRFEYETFRESLPPSIETILFRIVQEGATNIIRHAQASTVTVRLIQNENIILLEISDDGLGFDVQTLEAQTPAEDSLGLRGIQERAAILGGSFEVITNPGLGTTLRVQFDRSQWKDPLL
ncbi:MAG: cache domain-containing protein [Anaerolineales bacterium]